MALPSRTRLVPQCTACLTRFTFGTGIGPSAQEGASLRQQIRGKKKVANNSSGILPVRLLKDVKTFGKKGTIVPISVGQMRNTWFPRRIAEYVTMPELKTIRSTNMAIARDFEFGVEDGLPAVPVAKEVELVVPDYLPVRKAPEVQKLTPERAVELLQIFVPHRLDFYRQPILEEQKAPEPEPEPETQEAEETTHAKGAAADLLDFRTRKPKPTPVSKQAEGPQAIYGSVSTHDVLMAVRAALETNDESKRIALHETDIKIVNAVEQDALASGRVKHVGDFTVDIRVKGSEVGVKRLVRVHAQAI